MCNLLLPYFTNSLVWVSGIYSLSKYTYFFHSRFDFHINLWGWGMVWDRILRIPHEHTNHSDSHKRETWKELNEKHTFIQSQSSGFIQITKKVTIIQTPMEFELLHWHMRINFFYFSFKWLCYGFLCSFGREICRSTGCYGREYY